jgi:hypothetical protein
MTKMASLSLWSKSKRKFEILVQEDGKINSISFIKCQTELIKEVIS